MIDRIHETPSWKLTETIEDPEWDEYLEHHPRGQFQQSTVWAKVKAGEGWSVIRIKLYRAGKLEGGAQILYRGARLRRVAYVAKGPVVSDNFDLREAVARVQAVIRDHGMRAVIVQAPDFWQGDSGVFVESGGQRERLMSIIDATLAVDLARPIEMIRSEMDPETRRRIRQAERRGITVREADDDEIDLFFELMLESCKRQQVQPNPSSARGLKDLWCAFRGRSGARMTFAVSQGEAIGGLLSVRFGDRLTIWRKGWRHVDSRLNPNRLLYSEAIEWGHRQGLKWCDVGSLDRSIAEALIGGHPVPAARVNSRDAFHLSLGGTPFLFPSPYVFFPNAALRMAYRVGVGSRLSGWLHGKWKKTKRQRGD